MTMTLEVEGFCVPGSVEPGATCVVDGALRVRSNGTPLEGQRPALRVVFVVDVSGSMAGEKIQQVVQAVRSLVGLLGDRDSVGVVAFADASSEVLPLTPVTDDVRRLLERRMTRLMPNGNTNLSAGLAQASAMFATGAPAGTKDVILALTDGAVNRGAIGSGLLDLAGTIRAKASISSLGFGHGHDAAGMAQLAARAGGFYGYIADPAAATTEFAKALGAQADLAFDRVEARFEVEPGVEVLAVHALTRYSSLGLVVPLTSLRAADQTILGFQLRVTGRRELGRQRLATVHVRGRSLGEGTLEETAAVLDVLIQPERVVDREAQAVVLTDRAQRVRGEAATQARLGLFDAAVARLTEVIEAIESLPGYVSDGSVVAEAAEQLRDERTEYATRPSAERLSHFAAHQNVVQVSSAPSPQAPRAFAPSPPPPGLVLHVSGPSVTGAFPWDTAELTVGRAASGGIRLPAGNISRRHATFLWENGVPVVRDLGSTNPTRVRTAQGTVSLRQGHVLRDDDVVLIGDHEIRLVKTDPSKAP